MAIKSGLPQAAPPSDERVIWETVAMTISGIDISLATVRRDGPLDPILFCHGFGGTKEDYIDICFQKDFAGRAFLAYDTPGSGASTCSDLTQLSIPLLVEIAHEVTQRFFGGGRFHLLGHSMGGLTALLLARKVPQKTISFIDIKGNLAPEDCFLSRQIIECQADDPQVFMSEFIERNRSSPLYGSGLYAAALRAKVLPEVIRPTFESMVEISDRDDLLNIFESLPFPKVFMFGEQYASLSYLPRLAKAGVHLVEIPRAGHFVMYSNPVAMWDAISDHFIHVESGLR